MYIRISLMRMYLFDIVKKRHQEYGADSDEHEGELRSVCPDGHTIAYFTSITIIVASSRILPFPIKVCISPLSCENLSGVRRRSFLWSLSGRICRIRPSGVAAFHDASVKRKILSPCQA